jgi:ribA/ribD-fused uncharacterized protein
MKFDKELSYEEIAKLSRNHKLEYITWLTEEQKRKKEGIAKSDDNWKEAEFTLNNFLAARRDFLLEEEQQLPTRVNQNLADNEREKFTFFWETYSPLSQWHESKFKAPSYMWPNNFYENLVKRQVFPSEIEFTSAEQYMMYCKAMLFIDFETAKQILASNDPRKIKELGRQVKRFNDDTWYVFRWRFVYAGNKYKFIQNGGLRESLFKTQGTTLVETSPYDKVWGIGLKASDPRALDRSTWQGKNLLGEILTELRVELMGDY